MKFSLYQSGIVPVVAVNTNKKNVSFMSALFIDVGEQLILKKMAVCSGHFKLNAQTGCQPWRCAKEQAFYGASCFVFLCHLACSFLVSYVIENVFGPFLYLMV